MGKISRRPKSIAKDKTIFETPLYSANDPIGPTTLNPGPTLLKQVTAAEMFVSNPNGSWQMKRKINPKQMA